MIEIKVFEFFNGFENLSTRENGLLLRKEIEKLLEKNQYVVLNFEGINLITQSFADEVLGVLIRKNGIDFVRSKIKIKNASDFVKTIIKFVISYSKKVA